MSARSKLLDFLEEAYRPMTKEELMEEFEISSQQKQHFEDLLKQLQKDGLIYKSKQDKYGLPEKFDLVAGRIDKNPRGFGFLIPEEPGHEDIFINPTNLNGAMHNDKVYVKKVPGSSGKKAEGEVVEIIERANTQIVGRFEKVKNYGFVVADNKRISYDIFIPGAHINDAKNNQKVVAEITEWPKKNRNPEGKITEILGYQDEKGVDIEAIIRQLELPGDFPGRVKNELGRIPETIPAEEIEKRRDLRDLPMVTIDGEDAKDFDDAVSIEKLSDNKVRLGVHIADVTYYVQEDTNLDEEALHRGTSIYLVDRVIPMLPQKLSNNLCSLRPNEDRLSMSVLMDIKLNPLSLESYDITPSIINSNHRMTYNEVQSILVHENRELRELYDDFVDQLELMNKLRDKLRTKRFNEGSIDFERTEVKVILDDTGKPIDIQEERHGVAEQLIEEFMIMANKVVAEDMYWRDVPFIYRIHEPPDQERLKEFNEFIHNFGYHVKGIESEVHSSALQDVLNQVEDEPEENLINTVLLRTMKKAIYSQHNIGHYGLGLDYYTHFTSPIRRYPDLMIHRIIKEVLKHGKLSNNRFNELEERIPSIADHSSLQERRAMEAERDSVELKKIEYMQDKVGEEFEGLVSGITSFGFFVELENTVEGLVHVEDLKDDYYHIREDIHALVGERTNKRYRLGDEVKVKVIRVDPEEREIDFILVD
ncbi:MAG TPA: ribonuclease R [Halanaerobiales bacterium]|nr:ribonuclease R [Halanaerobiales bacterium]